MKDLFQSIQIQNINLALNRNILIDKAAGQQLINESRTALLIRKDYSLMEWISDEEMILFRS